ncbi:MAG: hypothetical protein KAH34_15410 [Ketobacter sp.]|uniref:hypothetical protein n=2 Tax=unclassified Ketobacter TaxID=2639109 RepID=UPI0025BE03C9|nr:hypothetical protein [Ketobacter sp.]MCK5792237.1 hypothetical protein [Ketobacter sp.]MEC8811887.1 hypothetical protein [Pseudomonadota bacterium]
MTTPTRRHPLRLRWLAGCAIAAAAIALSLLLTQRNAAPLVRQQMEAIPVLIPTPIPTPSPTLVQPKPAPGASQDHEAVAQAQAHWAHELPPAATDTGQAITVSDETDYDTQRQAQQMQVQYLQEVYPHTLMIPTEKTPTQVEQMLAEMELHRALKQRIDSGDASAEERSRYVELHRRKLEEEQDLITLCRDVAANSMAEESVHNALLCTHVAAAADQRLAVIAHRLAELDAEF